MQLEAQTTTRGFLAFSMGALGIAIIIKGTLEVLSLYLFFTFTQPCLCISLCQVIKQKKFALYTQPMITNTTVIDKTMIKLYSR